MSTSDLLVHTGLWLGEEPERQNGPTLKEVQWNALLRGTGFTGLEFQTRDSVRNIVVVSCMVSTASSESELSYSATSIISGIQPMNPNIDVLSHFFELTTSHKPRRTTLLEAKPEEDHFVFLALTGPFYLALAMCNSVICKSFL